MFTLCPPIPFIMRTVVFKAVPILVGSKVIYWNKSLKSQSPKSFKSLKETCDFQIEDISRMVNSIIMNIVVEMKITYRVHNELEQLFVYVLVLCCIIVKLYAVRLFY